MYTSKRSIVTITALAFAAQLAAAPAVHAMAVKQFFSDVIDGLSNHAQSNSTPQDVVDPSSGGCKSCNQTTVGDSSLGNLVDSVNQAGNKLPNLQCKDLAVGQSRVVDVDSWDSPTTVEHKYKLTRTAENEYDVAFNLDFTTARPGSSAVEVAGMKDRVKNCLGWANKALRGPNGEALKLRLQDVGEKPPAPTVGIKIENAGLVSSSRSYAADIDCPTVTHELLHILGLVDEYDHSHGYNNDFVVLPESEKGKLNNGYLWDDKKKTWTRAVTSEEEVRRLRELAGYDYSCRVLGPEDSIMRDSLGAFAKVFGSGTGVVLAQCSCGAPPRVLASKSANPPQACEAVIDSIIKSHPDNCPPGTKASEIQTVKFEQFDHTKPMPTRIGPNSAQIVAYGDPTNDSVSLLKPAHFRAITRPGCTVNNEYYLCSADAYNGTKGGAGREKCSVRTLPDACSHDSHSWLEAK